jgi:CubicO group peptidase (beta-lactamase class C family)
LFLVAVLVGWAGAAFGQTAQPLLKPGKAAAVDAAIQAEMRRQHVVGMAIGIIQGGQIAYVQEYGLADRENRQPVTPQTLFRWASCSKPLTAIAALQLAESGRLDLDANVRSYVPEFPDKGVVITARQLLCHQSGIVHYTNGLVLRTAGHYGTPHPFEDVVNALDTFKRSPLLFRPGRKFSYTTHGYILLSAVVQRAGKQKFAEQVAERIAQPLGLATLQPDYQWLDIPNRAVGYHKHFGSVERMTDTDVSWKLGGGGYISNIGDFARFAAALINGGLVSKPTEAMMWTQQKLADGSPTNWGLGFRVDLGPNGRLRVSHNGEQEKTATRLVIYPAEKSGVVIMSNCVWVNPGQFSTLIYTVLARN